MTNPSEPQPGVPPAPAPSIKLFAVGDAGIAVAEKLIAGGLPAAAFTAVNAGPLVGSSAAEQVLLESRPLRGLGSGGDPERARSIAEEHHARLKSLCEGARIVFVLAGLGGGSGTGIGPVLARAAREAGALVLAFVTTPFDCEGSRRQRIAQEGLDALDAHTDGIICLPSQRVSHLMDENTSVRDAFALVDDLLAEGALGIWRLLAHKGLIEIHPDELCALLRERHAESAFAAAQAAGPTRSRDVLEKLLAHPLLEEGQVLTESESVLVSVVGGPDLTMAEVNRVMEELSRKCERAQVTMGAVVDETFRDTLAVTLVVARCGHDQSEAPRGRGACSEELGSQLLSRGSTPRPGSRFVPPPPTLPPEQVAQMLSRRPASGRGRRTGPKLRQTQLPLEIVSKGRFEKSEPTIHKGEDLDVPTYIRRGVALN